ncbi:MAG: hypothetical protein CL930_05400 [Deltaproteobacteria bacterium]|nr:hypothetical protein [Deltaproteobacteria bacterium]|tara:strand:+ start:205 stop:651 length:447 start_codon:yes stop_codon:yes gene_type:complete
MMILLLLGALPMDLIGAPLPIYLEDADVAATLQKLTPELSACAATLEQTQSVHLKVGPEGKVQEQQWGSEPTPDIDCWTKAIEAHVFPAHRDETIELKTIVYVRDGRTFLSPQPEFFAREPGPLMLFVLPGDVPAARFKEALHGEAKQ